MKKYFQYFKEKEAFGFSLKDAVLYFEGNTADELKAKKQRSVEGYMEQYGKMYERALALWEKCHSEELPCEDGCLLPKKTMFGFGRNTIECSKKKEKDHCAELGGEWCFGVHGPIQSA